MGFPSIQVSPVNVSEVEYDEPPELEKPLEIMFPIMLDDLLIY